MGIDFANADSWVGGFYELAIEFGPTDDYRLQRFFDAIWHEHGSASLP